MFNTKTTKSVLLVAIMLVAAAGGALAAAPTVDTETTNTTTTSDLTDAGTQAYNDTTSSLLAWEADSPNSSVEITQDGETLYTASPDFYSSTDTGSDGNPDLWYYNVSLADDGSDYDGLEVGAGESVTLNVTFVNDTTAATSDTTNISYTYSNTDTRALIASENAESEDTEAGFFGGFSLASLNVFSDTSDDTEDVGTVLSTDSTTVTQNTTQVQLDTLNSNLTTAFSESTSDASAGDLVWSSYTQLTIGDDSQYVPVYYQTANEDHEWLNTTEDTYATISSDGQTMTIHNPDALLDDGQSSATMNVTTVGDESLGYMNARSMLTADQYDTSGGAYWTALGAGVDYNGNPTFVSDALEA
ncbi:hypothetical protein [Halolamina rubra]|uniref:hypothetical protein n=1 Tax=Halolamina rubra TaxID=1380430 RepID=UPI000679CC80|nr:hypothetical protein [Halolamina rubra]